MIKSVSQKLVSELWCEFVSPWLLSDYAAQLWLQMAQVRVPRAAGWRRVKMIKTFIDTIIVFINIYNEAFYDILQINWKKNTVLLKETFLIRDIWVWLFSLSRISPPGSWDCL